MELVEVYDKQMFALVMENLHAEYGDKQYNKERMEKEYNELVEGSLVLTVLYDGGKDVGHISYHKKNEGDIAASVLSVFINEAYRGKGYGKIMLKMFEEYVKKLGLNQIILGARRGREGFYYACGFSGEGLLQADYDKMEKAELLEVLTKNGIIPSSYVFRNNEIHQFYFSAKYLLEDNSLYSKFDELGDKLNLVVVFKKEF